ncbi:DUF4097 family beta strand repeat-containing protein [Actinomadura roseirufa]|uniref:DUF4097 family beta strand repeat-containing protein n=1 Tax=Actinomadura roseirufa TaxID=2094049 RepID=UPI001041464D|nr:DUF4097 family beta strand repeat-containing protein [Actinomadura roseirufa]
MAKIHEGVPEGRRPSADRQRVTWTAAGAALIVLAGAGLAACGRDWPDHWQSQQKTERQTFQHAVGALALDLSTGDIELNPGGPGRLDVQRRIRWSGSPPSFQERWDGDTFHVGDHCPGDTECSITYAISLPPGIPVTAHTRAGDVTVRNLSGTLALDSTAGNITGTGLAGARLTATTRAGDVRLGFARPPARVEAVSTAGEVAVDVPRGQSYLVQTSAKEGGATVQVPQAPDSGHVIIARSQAGDVQVGLSD